MNIDQKLLQVVKMPISRMNQAKLLNIHCTSMCERAIALGYRRYNRCKNLTSDQKLEVQMRFLNGESVKDLSTRFHISSSQVYKIGYKP